MADSSELRELVALFGRLGLTAFGGPAAHISMMHDEVVTRRRWMDDQRFVDLVGAVNLIPGPNSTEMAMHVGHDRAGWRGLLVAGAAFIVPAAVIVGVLAWAYVEYGNTPNGEALLYGVKPVVVVIVAQALLKLGRRVLTEWLVWQVAGSVAALYLVGVNELLLLAGGALAVLIARGFTPQGSGLAGIVLGFGLPIRVPFQLLPAPVDLGRVFVVFIKVGAVLYGSGYVLLALLRNDLVDRLALISDQNLLDAVSVGQFTPGPVFTTATFIGYLLAGVTGAIVATIAIFLPSFLFVGLIARLLPKIRERDWVAAALDGVNAAALGLIGGVLVQLSGDAVLDAMTVGIALAAAILLWRTKLNSAWLILGGGAAGIAATTVGLAS